MCVLVSEPVSMQQLFIGKAILMPETVKILRNIRKMYGAPMLV